MGTIPPLLLAFLPSFTDFLCSNRGLADALTLEDDPDNTILNEESHDAMSSIIPELESLKRERASLFDLFFPETMLMKAWRTRTFLPLQHQCLNAPLVIRERLGFICSHTAATARRGLETSVHGSARKARRLWRRFSN